MLSNVAPTYIVLLFCFFITSFIFLQHVAAVFGKLNKWVFSVHVHSSRKIMFVKTKWHVLAQFIPFIGLLCPIRDKVDKSIVLFFCLDGCWHAAQPNRYIMLWLYEHLINTCIPMQSKAQTNTSKKEAMNSFVYYVLKVVRYVHYGDT